MNFFYFSKNKFIGKPHMNYIFYCKKYFYLIHSFYPFFHIKLQLGSLRHMKTNYFNHLRSSNHNYLHLILSNISQRSLYRNSNWLISVYFSSLGISVKYPSQFLRSCVQRKSILVHSFSHMYEKQTLRCLVKLSSVR